MEINQASALSDLHVNLYPNDSEELCDWFDEPEESSDHKSYMRFIHEGMDSYLFCMNGVHYKCYGMIGQEIRLIQSAPTCDGSCRQEQSVEDAILAFEHRIGHGRSMLPKRPKADDFYYVSKKNRSLLRREGSQSCRLAEEFCSRREGKYSLYHVRDRLHLKLSDVRMGASYQYRAEFLHGNSCVHCFNALCVAGPFPRLLIRSE
jgi:hypothetical protein